MAAPLAALLAPFEQKSGLFRALVGLPPRRRGLGSKHVWLAVAAGSVAVLLIAAHRRKAAAVAAEARAKTAHDGPFRWVAGDEPPVMPSLMESPFELAERREAAPAVPSRRGSERREVPTEMRPSVWKVPEYSVEVPLPGMHRAALAITLGQPAELRRLALDLEQAGREAEAGLLGNYALLLERSNVSRERVMAEVARMLRAAVADRRSTQRTRRSASAAQPPAAAPTQPGPRTVIPLPVFAVGWRRRAAR